MILDIVRKLWSSVYDLLDYAKGGRRKTIEQIESDLDEIEYLCRPYADADDSDVCLREEGFEGSRYDTYHVRSPCVCEHCRLCCPQMQYNMTESTRSK